MRWNMPALRSLRLRLSIGLFVLYGACGIVLWQFTVPSGVWPLRLLGDIGSGVRAAAIACVLGATLLVTLDLIRRRVIKPLHKLSEYVQGQITAAASDDPPSILCGRKDEIGILTKEIRRMLATLREQNEKLLAQTLNDPLTGLGNRRLLDQRLETALPMSRRSMAPVSALMIDVDHFKAYNDYYGHPAGDDCLLEIANVLRDTFRRDTDILVRLGGEEFLVVLLDVDSIDALQMAEAMRGMLQFVAIPHEKSSTAGVVTVSIGVATVEPGTRIDVETLISCADSALYRCKSEGRNQSLHYLINRQTLAAQKSKPGAPPSFLDNDPPGAGGDTNDASEQLVLESLFDGSVGTVEQKRNIRMV
jgi:diguanylate cyclase (GGDEF)-like protein